jgi:MFS family permease
MRPRINGQKSGFSLRNIAVPVFGPAMLFSVGEGAVLPVVALSAREMGASVAVSALVVTLIGLGSWLFNLPASLITHRFGERWSIVAAALVGGLVLLAAGLAHQVSVTGIWILAPAMGIVGMSASVINLARQKYLTEAVPLAFRARALSTLGGTIRIGMFIGPFIGAGVMHFTGITGAYWVGAAGMFAAGALSLAIVDLVVPELPGSGGDGPAPSLGRVAASHARVFVTVGSGVLLLSAIRASRQVVIPLWAEHLGLGASEASLVFGLSSAIDMLVFYPAGKLMDKKGRPWVAVPSTVVMGTAMVVIPLTSEFATLLLAGLLVGFGNGISSGLVLTLGADFSPESGRGHFLGLWRFIADSGATAGPVLLSAVSAATSLAAGVRATGALGFAAALVFAIAIPKMRHRRNY